MRPHRGPVCASTAARSGRKPAQTAIPRGVARHFAISRRWQWVVLGLVFLVAMTGCSTFKKIGEYLEDDDNAIPPTPLVEFEPSVGVKKIWSIGVGAGAHKKFLKLSPVATPEGVYAAESKGRVYAVSAETGRLLWESDTDIKVSGGPGVGDGMVLVGSSQGEIVALAADDGEELWRAQVSSEILAAPKTKNGIVVVRTGDGKLFGLTASAGARLWIYDRSVPVLSLRGTSAPALSGDLVIAGFDSGRLVALELSTGRLVWDAAVAVPRGRSDLERMVDIDAEPLVYGNTVYVTTFQGKVAAIDITSGQELWSREISSFAGLTVDDRNVYITDEDSNVWALDRLTGVSVWKQEALKYRLATAPACLGEYVVVGDLEGYLHWMRTEDGEFANRVRLDKSKIIAPPVAFQDTIIAYSSAGELAAYTLE